MSHIVVLTDEEYNVLKIIVGKINSTIIHSPVSTPKKKTKTEVGLDKIREYRSNKRRKN